MIVSRAYETVFKTTGSWLIFTSYFSRNSLFIHSHLNYCPWYLYVSVYVMYKSPHVTVWKKFIIYLYSSFIIYYGFWMYCKIVNCGTTRRHTLSNPNSIGHNESSNECFRYSLVNQPVNQLSSVSCRIQQMHQSRLSGRCLIANPGCECFV